MGYYHVKHTTNEKIDYPLVSMAGLLIENKLRIAFSGVCSYPFRSTQIEKILNDNSLSTTERVDKSLTLLPENSHQDVEGSREYRKFVLKNMLQTLLEEIENDCL